MVRQFKANFVPNRLYNFHGEGGKTVEVMALQRDTFARCSSTKPCMNGDEALSYQEEGIPSFVEKRYQTTNCNHTYMYVQLPSCFLADLELVISSCLDFEIP